MKKWLPTWPAALVLLGGLLVVLFLYWRQAGRPSGAEVRTLVNLFNWQNALEIYKEQSGEYPDDANLADGKGLEKVYAELDADDQRSLELRDSFGMPFLYQKMGRHRYQLGSTGMDRQFGDGSEDLSAFGEGDDITNENHWMRPN